MSKTIIGRIREKQILSQALKSHRSELIAVYGRRRIGKTYLIREFYKNNIVFGFTGMQSGTRADQIENFMIKLNEVSYEFRKEKPSTWLEALHLLKVFLSRIEESEEKKVIFIDEFPWVDSHKSKFLPAFENFWNDYCTTRDDLIVVVCGSAASYIIKNIIRNKGGLYNRITRKIKLEPFNLSETEDFLNYKRVRMKRIEILKIYMTLGGIPEYLEYVESGDSSVTAIDRICFEKNAQLENEFDLVFKSLFDKGSYHERIVQILAEGKMKGMLRDDIIKEMEVKSGGEFSNRMDELIQSGFVQKYDSYWNNRKSILYRISDEFCLFHLQFLTKYKGASWKQLFNKQEYKIWCGYTFETVCLRHIENVKAALKCDQIASKNYAWSNIKAQVDIVIDRDDDTVNLCELKFYNDEFTIDETYYKKLLNKATQFQLATQSRKSINTVMITTLGVKSNENSRAILSNEITINSLFEA